MSAGLLITIIASVLFTKIVYDITTVKTGEATSSLLRIVICLSLLFSLLIFFLFISLIKYIKTELAASEIINTVIETTEVITGNDKEGVSEDNVGLRESNHGQEEASRGRKNQVKIKTVKTVSRSNSRENKASTYGMINNLSSVFLKIERPKKEEKMGEMKMKMKMDEIKNKMDN